MEKDETKGIKTRSKRYEVPNEKQKNKKLIYALPVILIILISGYFISNHFYYKTHFKGNTSLYNIQLKGMTVDEAYSKIINPKDNLSIVISDRDEQTYKISLKTVTDISKETIQTFFDTGKFDPKLNQELLKESIINLKLNEGATAAVNAKIVKLDNGFEIEKEVLGNVINEDLLIENVSKGINEGHKLNYKGNEHYLQPEIISSDKKLKEQVDTLKRQESAEITVQIGDDKIPMPQDKVRNSVTPAGIDNSNIEAFLAPLSEQYTNKGKDMEFTTHNGQKVTLNNDIAYTWGLEVGKSVELIKAAIAKGDSATVPLEIAGQGYNDTIQFGGNYTEVDLNAQKSYIFKDGKEVFSWDVITGLPNSRNSTSVGIHEVLYTQSPSVLRGTNNDGSSYATPVTYWIPFTQMGEGFHDAIWQTSGFGGDLYKSLGSHGCVNTSLSDMKQVWELMYAGMPVVIWGDIYN